MAENTEKTGFSFQFESNTPPETEANPLSGPQFGFSHPVEQHGLVPSEKEKSAAAEVAKAKAPSQPAPPQAIKQTTATVIQAPLENKSNDSNLQPLQPQNPSRRNSALEQDRSVAPSASQVERSLIEQDKTQNNVQHDATNSPVIRKVTFPSRSTKSQMGPEQQPKEPEAKSNHYSAVEKLRRLRSRAEPLDPAASTNKTKISDSLQATRSKATTPSIPIEEALHELSEPEDIISQASKSYHDAGGSDLDDSLWDTDSPNPAAVLNKVKLGWNTAAEQAGKWTQRGLRAGHHLGRDAVSVLRHPRQAAVSTKDEQISSIETPQVGWMSPEQKSTDSTQKPFPRLIRSLAGPLAALVACSIVYLGGSSFLEQSGLFLGESELTIPDLGSLTKSDQSAPSTATSPTLPQTAQAPIALSRYQKAQSSQPSTRRIKNNQPEQKAAKVTGPPPMATESTPMPKELAYPGKGLLEVVTSERELIYVNGVFVGRGPLRRIPLEPGKHEIRIKNNGAQRTGRVEVVATRRQRATFAAF